MLREPSFKFQQEKDMAECEFNNHCKLCGDTEREERKEGGAIGWRRDDMVLGQDRKSGKTWMDFRT